MACRAGSIVLVVLLVGAGGRGRRPRHRRRGRRLRLERRRRPLGRSQRSRCPTAEPPAELETEDIVVGDGAEAAAGDTVSVQYVGVNYSDGSEFDASWDTGEPFEFRLGSGSVIPGWDEGIPGMKVGGRRELVIPPDLAYGPQGQPPDIGPNETLIFVIDLLDVRSTQ